MSENSEFMTRVNRMPKGTKLERYSFGKHRQLSWRGVIELPGKQEDIGPINNADLGTVCEHLLILKRRREQGGLVTKKSQNKPQNEV